MSNPAVVPLTTPERELRKLAHAAVRQALGSGLLTRLVVCEECGADPGYKLAGHHHRGYHQDHWLDVIWLCRPCHGRAHWAERRRLSPTSTNEFEVAAAQQLLPTYLRLPRWLDDLTREEAERLGVKRHELLIRIIQEAMITH